MRLLVSIKGYSQVDVISLVMMTFVIIVWALRADGTKEKQVQLVRKQEFT